MSMIAAKIALPSMFLALLSDKFGHGDAEDTGDLRQLLHVERVGAVEPSAGGGDGPAEGVGEVGTGEPVPRHLGADVAGRSGGCCHAVNARARRVATQGNTTTRFGRCRVLDGRGGRIYGQRMTNRRSRPPDILGGIFLILVALFIVGVIAGTGPTGEAAARVIVTVGIALLILAAFLRAGSR